MTHLDAHPVRTLVERDVCGLGHYDVGSGDATRLTCVLAIAVERGDQTLRAAAGDHTDAGAVKQVGGHRDDLCLELRRARIHVALQDVGVGVEAEHLAEEGVVVVVTAVEAARHRALVALGVFGACHLGDLSEDRSPVDRLRGHLPIGLRGLPIGPETVEDLLETAVVAHRRTPSPQSGDHPRPCSPGVAYCAPARRRSARRATGCR